MPYKKGDIVEILREYPGDPDQHEFKKGDQVRIAAVYGPGTDEEHYKCDRDDDGRKTSWYVDRADLVKRRKK